MRNNVEVEVQLQEQRLGFVTAAEDQVDERPRHRRGCDLREPERSVVGAVEQHCPDQFAGGELEPGLAALHEESKRESEAQRERRLACQGWSGSNKRNEQRQRRECDIRALH